MLCGPENASQAQLSELKKIYLGQKIKIMHIFFPPTAAFVRIFLVFFIFSGCQKKSMPASLCEVIERERPK